MIKSLKILLLLVLSALASYTQVDPLDGLWQGFNTEWRHVSNQLVAEVLMHVAISNFGLLNVTGPKLPADLTSPDMEKTATVKPEVFRWLKRSLDAVKNARANLKPSDLSRQVTVNGATATVDGMYLRIIIHASEHMGQLVACARVNGIVPPWPEGAAKLPAGK